MRPSPHLAHFTPSSHFPIRQPPAHLSLLVAHRHPHQSLHPLHHQPLVFSPSRSSLPFQFHPLTLSRSYASKPQAPESGSRPSPASQSTNNADIAHAQFLASSTPSSAFEPDDTPRDSAPPISSPQSLRPHTENSSSLPSLNGQLSPTHSHLFKLVLPLPPPSFWSSPSSVTTSALPQATPTAFLLHPSQPLSHLSRLIAGSLPPAHRGVEISYISRTPRNLTSSNYTDQSSVSQDGQSSDDEQGSGQTTVLSHTETADKVSWSQSTDLSDFIKQSCMDEKFTIVIKQGDDRSFSTSTSTDEKENKTGQVQKEKPSLTLTVSIPTFANRTIFLRRRLLSLTKDLDRMTKLKKEIDTAAHRSAQRMAVVALGLGVAYWGAIVRFTFFTEAGWDLMEPVTWTTSFGALLCSAAFLIYHNREVSYSSLLDLSISARKKALYDKAGLHIELWTELVAEAKEVRKEILRIAGDYDIEWKGDLDFQGDLEPLSRSMTPTSSFTNRRSALSSINNHPVQQKVESSDKKLDKGKRKGGKEEEEERLDVDKTIDEADELARESEDQDGKEKERKRKGEDGKKGRWKEEEEEDQSGSGRGGGKDEEASVKKGREKARALAR